MNKETRNLLLWGALGITVIYIARQQQENAQAANVTTALIAAGSLAGGNGVHGYGWPGYGRIWNGV
jgi:hypothetical protein